MSDGVAERLQALLDRSYDGAGEHLASIHTDGVRLTAQEVVDELVGMKVLVVATTSADGRPLSGPVDAFFHAGHWRFGTAEGALRHKHLLRRPTISATYVQGEAVVVTAHGRARQVDIREDASFHPVLRAQYGDDIEGFLDHPYWEVVPDRIFAADMRRHLEADAGA